MPSVIDILKKDHQRVKKLLSELTDTTTRAHKTREELLAKIETELVVHTAVEEELVYPAIREAARTNSQREMVAEAIEEHRAVDELVLPDLKAAAVDSVQFSGRAKVLKELVEHHVQEEEQELLPLAKKLCDAEQLEELGEQVKARKLELLRERHAA